MGLFSARISSFETESERNVVLSETRQYVLIPLYRNTLDIICLKNYPYPFLDLMFKMFFSKLKQAWFSGGWAGGNTRSSLVTGELVQI